MKDENHSFDAIPNWDAKWVRLSAVTRQLANHVPLRCCGLLRFRS